jgi:hypothetical protein
MLQRNAKVLWRELDGEAVLLDPTAGCSYTLNKAGALIWQMLDGEHAPHDIAMAICESYEVEFEQALRDVERTLSELSNNNLLERPCSPQAAM